MPPQRILVVDDDASIRRLVATVLKRERYDVDMAHGGKDALSMIAQTRYDVIVLDLMMPEISGRDVLAAIGARYPTLKCVVIMSAGSRFEVASSVTSNVFTTISKPFDIASLVTAVRGCIDDCQPDAPPVPKAA